MLDLSDIPGSLGTSAVHLQIEPVSATEYQLAQRGLFVASACHNNFHAFGRKFASLAEAIKYHHATPIKVRSQ
jgi:hypothetical protein